MGDEGLDELVVARFRDVDPLDATAALARIVEGAVDEVLGGEGDVCVLEHEGGILAAELEARGDEVPLRERAVDLVAPAHRAGERDVAEGPGVDQARRRRVVHRHRLDEARRCARFEKSALELIGDERRLRGVLHEHRIARQHRRHDHVHRDRERIVPGRDVEHDTDRLVADEALEARRIGGKTSSARASAAIAQSCSTRSTIVRSNSARDCAIGLPIMRVIARAFSSRRAA